MLLLLGTDCCRASSAAASQADASLSSRSLRSAAAASAHFTNASPDAHGEPTTEAAAEWDLAVQREQKSRIGEYAGFHQWTEQTVIHAHASSAQASLDRPVLHRSRFTLLLLRRMPEVVKQQFRTRPLPSARAATAAPPLMCIQLPLALPSACNFLMQVRSCHWQRAGTAQLMLMRLQVREQHN